MNRETKLDDEINELEKEIYGTPKEPTVEEIVNEAVADIPSEPQEEAQVDAVVEDDIPAKPKRTNWKKRFIGLKQSQDATIYSLRSENADLKSQVLNLDAKVSQLIKDTKVDDPFDNLFTDEDKDVLGSEALDIFTKASKTAVDAAVSPLKAKLDEEKQHRRKQQEREVVNERQAASKIFLDKLANLVPDYNELDYDPGFKKWMDQPDTFSGFPRKQLFLNAQKHGDVVRVAEFFIEYSDLTRDPVEQSQRTLENAVGPTGSSASQINTDKKLSSYSMEMVEQFYDDVTRGKYVGKESEAKALESKYDRAFAEGRII